jgi:hypothetical protein
MGISPPLDTTINEGDSGALSFFDAIATYLNNLPDLATGAPPAIAATGSAGTSTTAMARGDHTHAGLLPSTTNLPKANARLGVIGTAALASREDHKHPRATWAPPDSALFAASDDPSRVRDGAAIATAGALILIRLNSGEGGTIGNVDYGCVTQGSGGTTNQNLIGIYSAAGARIGSSGDQTANFASSSTVNGRKTALTPESAGSLTLAAGVDFFVGILANGGTGPTLWRVGTLQFPANYGLTGAALRWGTIAGPFTALPASLTLSSMTATQSFWAGVST